MAKKHIIKRVLDFVFSFIFLIIFSPILLLLSLSIYISAGRPIIFKSTRIGQNKKRFTVYKFRTLVNGIKRRKDGLSDKVVINKLAELMRETHLDEVLQLINIVKGDVSFIGPRPLDEPRYYHLKTKDPGWREIFTVKPGMTCLNQIGRYSPRGWKRIRQLKGLKSMRKRNRLKLDHYYIRHENAWLDIRITWWTIEYLIIGFFEKAYRKITNKT